jgi:hypothetical protein
MQDFEIVAVKTHAKPGPEQGAPLVQWAEVTILFPKGFDWDKNGRRVADVLRHATELVGKGE